MRSLNDSALPTHHGWTTPVVVYVFWLQLTKTRFSGWLELFAVISTTVALPWWSLGVKWSLTLLILHQILLKMTVISERDAQYFLTGRLWVLFSRRHANRNGAFYCTQLVFNINTSFQPTLTSPPNFMSNNSQSITRQGLTTTNHSVFARALQLYWDEFWYFKPHISILINLK